MGKKRLKTNAHSMKIYIYKILKIEFTPVELVE